MTGFFASLIAFRNHFTGFFPTLRCVVGIKSVVNFRCCILMHDLTGISVPVQNGLDAQMNTGIRGMQVESGGKCVADYTFSCIVPKPAGKAGTRRIRTLHHMT
ncbi:MAG: hypothetical protein K2O15_10830, partial [Lachnospiraceae bacterium]|nr:hypothetical protein [Lachnospiraceae bacterium]